MIDDEWPLWLLGQFIAIELVVPRDRVNLVECAPYRFSDLSGNEMVLEALALPRDVDLSHLAEAQMEPSYTPPGALCR